jgi:hypothetical protein
MTEDGDPEFSTPEGDEYVFPVKEISPAKSPEGPGKPPIRPNQNAGENLDNGGQDRQLRQNPESNPLSIRIVDELSTFEGRTLLFGQWGLGVSIASLLITVGALIAAIFAALAAFSQLHQMQVQTEILFANAIQASFDSSVANIATAKQLDLFQGQLKQQQDATALDQRPWISITPSIAGALTFVGGGVTVPIRVTAHNSGKTPAIDSTSGGVKIEVVGTGDDWTTKSKIDKMEKFCKALMKPDDYLQANIFPNTDRVTRTPVGITGRELDRRWQKGNKAPGVDQLVSFRVMVCVPYRSAFDRGKWYYTAGIYELDRFAQGRSVYPGNFKLGEMVPEEGMSLDGGLWPEVAR